MCIYTIHTRMCVYIYIYRCMHEVITACSVGSYEVGLGGNLISASTSSELLLIRRVSPKGMDPIQEL